MRGNIHNFLVSLRIRFSVPVYRSSAPYRNYSIKRRAIDFNQKLNKIADESTRESAQTLKAVRMIGAGSVIAVICSLLWASSISAPAPVTDVIEIEDLSKDVRDS